MRVFLLILSTSEFNVHLHVHVCLSGCPCGICTCMLMLPVMLPKPLACVCACGFHVNTSQDVTRLSLCDVGTCCYCDHVTCRLPLFGGVVKAMLLPCGLFGGLGPLLRLVGIVDKLPPRLLG